MNQTLKVSSVKSHQVKRDGFSQPMWIMTDLQAEDGLNIYLQRMKIEESFRDMKSLLGLERLINKRRDHMEKMVALLLIAYAIGLWLGEVLRETLFPKDSPKKNSTPACSFCSNSNSASRPQNTSERPLRLSLPSALWFQLSDRMSEI